MSFGFKSLTIQPEFGSKTLDTWTPLNQRLAPDENLVTGGKERDIWARPDLTISGPCEKWIWLPKCPVEAHQSSRSESTRYEFKSQ